MPMGRSMLRPISINVRIAEDVTFRTILVHGFSPKMGQWFSPKLVHWFSAIGVHVFSPKLGHGGGEAPSCEAYFSFSRQREWEETCLERGRRPWTFERC